MMGKVEKHKNRIHNWNQVKDKQVCGQDIQQKYYVRQDLKAGEF